MKAGFTMPSFSPDFLVLLKPLFLDLLRSLIILLHWSLLVTLSIELLSELWRRAAAGHFPGKQRRR